MECISAVYPPLNNSYPVVMKPYPATPLGAPVTSCTWAFRTVPHPGALSMNSTILRSSNSSRISRFLKVVRAILASIFGYGAR